MSHEQDLQKLIQFFETLTPETAASLNAVYAPDTFFKDPFNEVHGIAATTYLFTHMFKQVHAPRFVITSHVLQGDSAFMVWDFMFTMKRFSDAPRTIRGATHVRFNQGGLVNYHRDYWDVAEELYEKLPMLGSLMRLLKKAART